MNMKVMACILMGLCFSINALGQAPNPAPPEPENRAEKVQAAKVAYITTRLNLSPLQAQQFWPVYNEFELARKKIRKQIKQLVVDTRQGADPSEEQLKTDLKKFMSLRQEELDLEKSYMEKFLKVISAKQLVEYYRSEKMFAKLLIDRIKGGGRGPGKRGGKFETEED